MAYFFLVFTPKLNDSEMGADPFVRGKKFTFARSKYFREKKKNKTSRRKKLRWYGDDSEVWTLKTSGQFSDGQIFRWNKMRVDDIVCVIKSLIGYFQKAYFQKKSKKKNQGKKKKEFRPIQKRLLKSYPYRLRESEKSNLKWRMDIKEKETVAIY